MKVIVTSLFVDDQYKALEFYTEKLGFIKKEDEPAGEIGGLQLFPQKTKMEQEFYLNLITILLQKNIKKEYLLRYPCNNAWCRRYT